MRFSALTPPHDPSHPRRQRNADQPHRLIIPPTTATPTAPLTAVGNAAAPLAWDPGVRHPIRQRRIHPIPPALPPPSPSPPLLSPTEDARSQRRLGGPPGSFCASFSEEADTDVGAGDGEGGTDDEYEADDRAAFVPGPRRPYSRSSAREVAPRSSQPHNLRAHPSSVSATHIAAQPTYRVNSDRGGTRASTTTTPMARRRRRSDDEDSEDEQAEDGEGVQLEEERSRYRPRLRRRCSSSGSDRGISLKLSLPDPAPKHATRYSPLSPPFPRSPPPNSLRLHLPAVPTPRRHPAAPDETAPQQPQPTRLEPTKPIKLRSPSVESVKERSVPPAPVLQPVQQKATVPNDSPGSAQAAAPASAPTPDTSGAMLSDSEMADETEHLRAQLGCPPGAPVGLSALVDPPPGEKPNYPLPTLIKLAIYDSPRSRLTLQEIYQALEDRFEWFRQRTDELSWKNSIRHNLSLRKCFLKVQRPITEPGKGSYWMIDLTQGEGNKRVRKRNKKPTKSQLAAQAYRLPGQGGESRRPTPYPPLPSHARQPTFKEDNLAMDCDDDYQPQAPPVQTNFTTKATEQPQSQHSRTIPTSRGAATLSSSLRAPELPELDANIDPALRVPVAAPTSGPSKAPHLSHIPPGAPVVQTPQVQAQQMMLPRPPHHSPYHRPLLPQTQGAGRQPPQTAVSVSHISHARLSMPSLHHSQTNPQRRATAALAQQQQTRAPRLPPMRTLSQSPDPTSSEPAYTSPPPSPPSTASGPPTSPLRPTTGFARFARAPIAFTSAPVFGKPPPPASPSMHIRPLVVSDAANTSSSSSSSSSVATAPAAAEGEGGGRRRFVPPPPRAGIEYVQREGGGLVTARRSSGRYEEGTIDWLGSLDRVNADSAS